MDDLIGLLMTVGLSKDAFAIQERFGSPDNKDLLVVMVSRRGGDPSRPAARQLAGDRT